MAYDEVLAGRLRQLLTGQAGLSERAMFGGLGFMIDRRLAVAANAAGALMVRVDPATAEGLLDGERVRLVEMRGRTMRGWLHVEPDVIAGDADLDAMVAHGIGYVRSLPAGK